MKEYKVYKGAIFKEKKLEQILNEMGSEGWTYHSLIPNNILIFEREK